MRVQVLLVLISLCLCGQMGFSAIPPRFERSARGNIGRLTNIWWDADEDKPHPCDVWLNYEKRENRGGPKLFEYVSVSLMKKPSFVAFIDAFYRTRSELRHASNSANVNLLQRKQHIFSGFLDDIFQTPVFEEFKEEFRNHPWFVGNNDVALKQRLVELWVGQEEKTGFDHIFMGDVVRRQGQTDTYGGMTNWLAFHLNEEGNTIHYYNTVTGQFPRFPNGHANLWRYSLISDVDFVFNDIRYNRGHHPDNNLHRTIRKIGHSMLMRTSPAFEFCLYTAIALINNDAPHFINGVHEAMSLIRTGVFRITKTARVEIMGCPIDIQVLMVVNTNPGQMRAYIENVSPLVVTGSNDICNIRLNPQYNQIRATCGTNENNDFIQHFQKNVTLNV